MALEIPLNGGCTGKSGQLLVLRTDFITAMRRRPYPRHHGVAGGSAHGDRAVSIGKIVAALGQGVHIGRLGLRMSIHEAHPVIQIVDGDKEYIWLGALCLAPKD